MAFPEASTSAAQRHRCCQIKSFIDPSKRYDNTNLLTQIVLDTRTAFVSYQHTSDEVSDVTFNVKDFRNMVAFCDHLGADAVIRWVRQ